MYQIKVEMPHIICPHTFERGVTGWVSRKGTRYPGFSTKINFRNDKNVVQFNSAKQARVWAKRNIWDPRAKITIIDATMPVKPAGINLWSQAYLI